VYTDSDAPDDASDDGTVDEDSGRSSSECTDCDEPATGGDADGDADSRRNPQADSDATDDEPSLYADGAD
jgi:hypothetical protein